MDTICIIRVSDVLACGDISRSFWEGLLTIPGGATVFVLFVCPCPSSLSSCTARQWAVNHQPVKYQVVLKFFWQLISYPIANLLQRMKAIVC